MLEIRTVAGPPGVVQWVLSGGPYTAWSQSRHVQVVCPPRALERRLMAYEHFAEAEGVPVGSSGRRVRLTSRRGVVWKSIGKWNEIPPGTTLAVLTALNTFN